MRGDEAVKEARDVGVVEAVARARAGARAEEPELVAGGPGDAAQLVGRDGAAGRVGEAVGARGGGVEAQGPEVVVEVALGLVDG